MGLLNTLNSITLFSQKQLQACSSLWHAAVNLELWYHTNILSLLCLWSECFISQLILAWCMIQWGAHTRLKVVLAIHEMFKNNKLMHYGSDWRDAKREEELQPLHSAPLMKCQNTTWSFALPALHCEIIPTDCFNASAMFATTAIILASHAGIDTFYWLVDILKL